MNKRMMEDVAKMISPDSKMHMRGVTFTDVGKEMQQMFPKDMIVVPDMKIMVDINATLIIEKTEGEKLIDYPIKTDELMMYPFTKNIGVVFANELIDMTETHLAYDIHVIAPSFATELFELDP
jgi:hypothetical protein